MDRRNFLKSAFVYSLSLCLPGLEGFAYNAAGGNGKKLIVVFLRGAVDGLNVVVPYNDPDYYNLRPTIAVARPSEVLGALNLDGHFGLNPAMQPLMPYWKQGSLAFVHSSGSPDPTRSHFDAQDYMESGAPGMKAVSTGWMNRLLGCIPNNHSPVRALNFGPTIPRIMEGPSSVANVAIGNQSKQKMSVDRPAIAKAFEAMYGNGTDLLSRDFVEGMEARRTIASKLDQEMVMANQGAPLPNNTLGFGRQIAQLFAKDPTVQMAFIAFGGWDTHVNQGAGKGQLANRLGALSSGLADLIQGLGPVYNDTCILVMSEFGRTAKENGNGGTDHGHGNVMWLMGGGVRGQKVYGKWNNLGRGNLYEGRDLPVTTDFRNVAGTILTKHMSLPSENIAKVFPNFTYSEQNVTNILKPSST